MGVFNNPGQSGVWATPEGVGRIPPTPRDFLPSIGERGPFDPEPEPPAGRDCGTQLGLTEAACGSYQAAVDDWLAAERAYSECQRTRDPLDLDACMGQLRNKVAATGDMNAAQASYDRTRNKLRLFCRQDHYCEAGSGSGGDEQF